MRRPGAFTGWLYADLMLALFVVFLAATTGGAVVSPPGPVHATPGPSAGPTPTPSPTPTCPPTSAVLKKYDLPAVGDPSQPDGLPNDNQLRSEFAPFDGRVAGIVLTFAHAPTAGDAENLSDRLNNHLQQLLPTLFAQNVTIMEHFSTTDSNVAHRGQVTFDLYLLAPPCA